MLKVGTQNISGLYVGPKNIKKGYLGEALVFGAEPPPEPGPSRLPDGYTEVEYIQSDNACYIDTNIIPFPLGSTNATASSDTKIVVDVEPLESPASSDKYICFSNSSKTTTAGSTSYYFYLSWKTPAGVYGRLSNLTYKSIVTNENPRRMQLELNGVTKSFALDGSSYTFSSSILASNASTIKLLGTSVTTARIQAKLYSCQIYKGPDLPLVRDFVPCISPSGAVGLYDLVEGKFYGNSGTGTLTAGPAV